MLSPKIGWIPIENDVAPVLGIAKKGPIVYRLTIGFTVIPALYDAFSTLSTMTGLFTLPTSLVEFFTTIVPFGQFSMGWISFALVGFILSIFITKVKKA